ncbi:MAG: hypothetical protein Q9209_005316 [Squamulea sp. 1 TL-2023]
MTQPTQYFRTLNGEPPNGGVPPGVAFYAIPQHPAPPAASSPPPPPYGIHYYPVPDPRMFLPPSPAPPPPPPYTMHYHPALDPRIFLPPQPPASAPKQWSPPGSTLLNQPAPSFQGVSYLYPESHTVLHIIWDLHMSFTAPTATLRFEARLFPTGLTVGELIRRLGAPTTDDSKFGVQEVHELGDGRWSAGTTVLLNSELAKKSLREVGWGETRGFAAKPVWIKVHTVA